jgi:hypothetical protein
MTLVVQVKVYEASHGGRGWVGEPWRLGGWGSEALNECARSMLDDSWT